MVNIQGDKLPETAVISWSAVIGGAVVMGAISLALLVLGGALELISTPPETAVAFTVKAAVWLIVMQWVAAAVGGYLTGRLRIRWTGVSTDEAYFRDTAHGFLAWSLATLITAASFASASAWTASEGNRHLVAQTRTGAFSDPLAYHVDALLRSNSDQNVRQEATRILARGVESGRYADSDKAYLTQMVANKTGLSPDVADKRVRDTITQIDADKEAARKAGIYLATFTALSMFIGAFIACVTAVLGGRWRDSVQ